MYTNFSFILIHIVVFLYHKHPKYTVQHNTLMSYNSVLYRLKKSHTMQQYADIYLLLNYSTCFGRPSRPSSGVPKTVVAASGTDHTIWEVIFFKRDQIRTYLVTFEEACFPDSTICTRGCNYSFMYS